MRYSVRVKPGSNKNEIEKLDLDKKHLIVRINAPAQDNKANIELVKFLRKELKWNARIVAGLKSKDKIIKRI